MSVLIENGFRYPLNQFPDFIPDLHAVLVPLADREAARIASELTAMAQGAPGLPWETLRLYAPRNFTPTFAMERATSPQQVAVDLVCDLAEHGMHRGASWSAYDAGVRVDLWTVTGDDADAQYVYGRIVASTGREFHEALIATGRFEDYSYWAEEHEAPEWAARGKVWNRIKERSHFEWKYLPSYISVMNALEAE